MDYERIEEYSEEIEVLDGQAEQQKKDLEQSEQKVKTLELAVSRVEKDDAVARAITKNLSESKTEVSEQKKSLEEKEAEIHNLENELQAVAEQLNDEYETLRELMELGEDVSDALEILEARQKLIESCHDRLEEVASKLGISINDLCSISFSEQGDSSEKNSVEESEKPSQKGDKTGWIAQVADGESIIPLNEPTSDMRSFSGTPICKGVGGYWYPADGLGFQKFMEYDNADWSDYEIDTAGYENRVEMINSRCIEGVTLYSGDVESPERFWSQHQADGTKESFVEIASHIPEVKRKLAEGIPLSELYCDEKLEACASLYFTPESGNALTVFELDDGVYVFQSNGRHRVLAARELGYSFPVRVKGRLRKKNIN